MREFSSEPSEIKSEKQPGEHVLVERVSNVRRQYVRAREFCGYSLDELINSRSAQRCLREVWLLGCMVRKPRKAKVLPPGNPFKRRCY